MMDRRESVASISSKASRVSKAGKRRVSVLSHTTFDFGSMGAPTPQEPKKEEDPTPVAKSRPDTIEADEGPSIARPESRASLSSKTSRTSKVSKAGKRRVSILAHTTLDFNLGQVTSTPVDADGDISVELSADHVKAKPATRESVSSNKRKKRRTSVIGTGSIDLNFSAPSKKDEDDNSSQNKDGTNVISPNASVVFEAIPEQNNSEEENEADEMFKMLDTRAAPTKQAAPLDEKEKQQREEE